MNDNGIHIFIKKNIPNSFFRSTENYVESWTIGGTKKKGVTRNVGAPLRGIWLRKYCLSASFHHLGTVVVEYPIVVSV